MEELEADAENAPERIYEAISDWVWTSLTERRLDEALREWHGLILDLEAEVRDASAEVGARFQALARLVRKSLTMADRNPIEKVLKREHILPVLRAIAQSNGDYCARGTLMERTRLGQSNLSRVFSILSAHNLIERRPDGKKVQLRLTLRGERAIGIQREVRKKSDALAEAIVAMRDMQKMPPNYLRVEHRHAGDASDEVIFVEARIDPQDTGTFAPAEAATIEIRHCIVAGADA